MLRGLIVGVGDEDTVGCKQVDQKGSFANFKLEKVGYYAQRECVLYIWIWGHTERASATYHMMRIL